MAGPSSGAAPPKESAEGKSAGGAPKLMRAMRFLPKTAEGREAAKKRIKSKKQVGGAADGEDGAEDKEKDKGAHEQKDSWKAKMAKAVRRKKPKKPKTGEMTMVLNLMLEMQKQGMEVPKDALWLQTAQDAASRIQRVYRKRLRRKKLLMMAEQVKQVATEVGTTVWDEEDNPYAEGNNRDESDPGGDTDDDEAEFSEEDVDNIFEERRELSESARASWRKAFNVINKGIVRTQVLMKRRPSVEDVEAHVPVDILSSFSDVDAFLEANAVEEEEEEEEEEEVQQEEQQEEEEEKQQEQEPMVPTEPMVLLEDPSVSSIGELEAQIASASEEASAKSLSPELGRVEEEPQQPEAPPAETKEEELEAEAPPPLPPLDLPAVDAAPAEEPEKTGETPVQTPGRTPRSASRSPRTPRINPLEDPDFYDGFEELKAKGPSLSQRPTWPKRLERLNDPNRRSVQEGRAPRFVYQESSWQGVIFRPVRKRNTIPRIKAKRGIDDALVFPLVRLSGCPESVELVKEQSRNSSWCYEYGSFPVMTVAEESSFGVDGARLSLPESQSLPCLPGLWKQPAAGGGDNGSYLSIRGREDMAMACLAQGEALGAAMDGTGPLMQSRSDTWRDGPYYYLQPLPGSDDWPVERAGERNGAAREGRGLSSTVPAEIGEAWAPRTHHLQATSSETLPLQPHANHGSGNSRSHSDEMRRSSSAVLPRLAREAHDTPNNGSRKREGIRNASITKRLVDETPHRGNAAKSASMDRGSNNGDGPLQPFASRSSPAKKSGRALHHNAGSTESVDRNPRRGKGRTGSSAVDAQRINSLGRPGDAAKKAGNVTDRLICASTNLVKVSADAAQSQEAELVSEAVAKSTMKLVALQDEGCDDDRPCRPGTVRKIPPMAGCSLPRSRAATKYHRGPPLPKLEDLLLLDRASPDGRRRPHPPLGASPDGRRRPPLGASQRRCRNELLAEPPFSLAPKMNATARVICP